MKLQKLMSYVQYAVIQEHFPINEIDIHKITCSSAEAERGDMFVCISGEKHDGHAYIEEAYRRGARVFIVERILPFPENATVLLVNDTRAAFSYLSAAFFDYPAKKLKVIGVTGTKGKTTVAGMIHQMLERTGRPAGLIGTNGIQLGEERIQSKNTTPDAFTIQKYFDKIVRMGYEYAVMEVSSQGLKQKRVEGIPFEIAIFTNFAEDHVGKGEHATLEEYRYYKAQLFMQAKTGIGNIDDPQCRYMFQRCPCEKYGFSCFENVKCKWFCKNDRVMRAENIKFFIQDEVLFTSFEVDGEEYRLRLPGLFNVYNALAAMQTIKCLGIWGPQMKEVFEEIQIDGRMEPIYIDKNIACYVDYAHNALSLKEVLRTCRCYGPKRIILVFGCGGNRAKSRRTQMGRVAGAEADVVIVTSDNPRRELPEKIIKDILEGMTDAKAEVHVIIDRKEAIACAVKMAREGDIVLVAGKGHETYQEVNGIRYDMDDRELIRSAQR